QGADRVRVAVSGGDRPLRDNVRAHLGLGELPCDIPELQLRSRLRGADGRISEALRALGHYRGQWQVDSELVEGDSPCWRVRVSLEPGEPVLVGDMTVRVEGEGAADPRFTRYLRSEEHTSELQSRENLVCRLLLEKKKTK